MRSMYRSWLLLPVLLLTFALVLVACNGDDDDDTADVGADTDDTEQVDTPVDDEATDDSTDDATTDDATTDDATADDAATDDAATDDAATEDEEDTTDSGEVADVNETLGGPIIFGDFNWDSAMFHNRVAQFVIENGYGYETDVVPGSTLPLLQGLEDGDVHVTMEMWVQNLPEWYHDEVEAGTYIDLGNNYDEAVQGWFVPTYVIEGDEERGIEPMAPDLQTVDDLPEYWDVFEDEEDPEKGRIYNGIGGWEATENNEARLQIYGLDEYYNSFLPGSEAALFTSLAREYELGNAWIGYLWTPSWPFAEYDMTLIEEPEYTEECWEAIQAYTEGESDLPEEACGFPEVTVNVVVNPEFNEAAPHLVEFLTNYESNMDLTNSALLHISETGATPDEAAEWWLRENEDIWTQWVPEDIADAVRDAL